ncbi:HNH endonuclease [Bdellovibrio sp. BCCA]|uniref:HNH endonuclease n=1 Tax=Bdellovibrio sp. BCCA TaxID=3136281 RepID=UPI0030F1AB46
MNIRYLSDENLEHNLKSLVQKEREILSDILLHIAEVDRRKLYLSKAFPSLFDYLTKHLGYSAGSAQRRIDAARLSRDIPEVAESLEIGSLNLSQVSLLQKAIRQTQKEIHMAIPVETKKEILNELVGKSHQESEVLVAKALSIEIKQAVKIQHQADESVRFEVSLSKEQWQKMEEMRSMLSHSLPNGSWDEVLEFIADKVIQQKTRRTSKNSEAPRTSKSSEIIKSAKSADIRERQTAVLKHDTDEDLGSDDILNHLEVNSKTEVAIQREYIPAPLRRMIFQRDQCCQHVDKTTGRKCTSKWQLEIDHIQPVWAGGKSTEENLRLLCAAHNRMKYKQEAGVHSL